MHAPNRQLLAALALGILLAAPGKAREQAEIAPVSRSTIAINASVAPRMQVMGIRHIGAAELASSKGTRRLALCVVANTGVRSYSVTASGPPDGSGDFLISAGRRSLPIALEWRTVAGGARLAPDIAASGFSAADGKCSDGETGTILAIRPKPESGQLAGPQSQQTALTIVIAPE